VVISGFDWDEDNILHIERHQFTPEEVEEVFDNDYKVRRTRQKAIYCPGRNPGRTVGFGSVSAAVQRFNPSGHGP